MTMTYDFDQIGADMRQGVFRVLDETDNDKWAGPLAHARSERDLKCNAWCSGGLQDQPRFPGDDGRLLDVCKWQFWPEAAKAAQLEFFAAVDAIYEAIVVEIKDWAANPKAIIERRAAELQVLVDGCDQHLANIVGELATAPTIDEIMKAEKIPEAERPQVIAGRAAFIELSARAIERGKADKERHVARLAGVSDNVTAYCAQVAASVAAREEAKATE